MKTLWSWLKKGGRYCLWLTAIILALNAGRLTYRRFFTPMAYASSPFPYTAMYVEQAFDNTGTLKVTNLYSEAVRSDGSKMFRRSGPLGAETHAYREIEFANGDYMQIDEIRGRKVTFPQFHASAPPLRDPESSCVLPKLNLPAGYKQVNEVVVGEDKVGEYRTVQIKMDQTTTWYALDQGCAKVKVRYEFGSAVTEQNLVSLIPGEPDGTLFRAPESFLEVPPSQLASCINADGSPRATPCRQSQARAALLQQYDKLYYEKRKAAGKH